MSKNKILQKIKEQKDYLSQRYFLKKIGLFGSFARGEESLISDVDVLFETHENANISLFELVDMKIYLEKLLGLSVDIVDGKMLKPALKSRILSEVIMI